MKPTGRLIGDLFLPQRLFVALAASAGVFVTAYFIPFLEPVALLLFLALIFLIVTDYVFLFFSRRCPTAKRILPRRLSNGEDNVMRVIVRNRFTFPVFVELIDEMPAQLQQVFQERFFLRPRKQTEICKTIRPTIRGEYEWGDLLLFVNSPLRLITRRIRIHAKKTVPVYPGFLRLHQYEILGRATMQRSTGAKRMSKVGQSMEFDQIKDYVVGDDIRNVNWKATARRSNLMVNSFVEERAQQVYCVIDKGRLMRMPFEGMTLLDYAINSTLALASVCLKKFDKVGLITFSDTVDTVLAADRRPVQKGTILQALYKQQTSFSESNFESLHQIVRNQVKHRSLLVLFTNFETTSGLERQLPYLRSLARHHLLLLVFFDNTELQQLLKNKAQSIPEVYEQAVARRFTLEKRHILRELHKAGILSLLSTPNRLTPDTISKYLEIKSRQAL